MLLMPDPKTAYIDPFFDETTLVLSCDVIDPPTARVTTATRVPSPTAPKAYLKSSGIGDTAYFGPEPEFFIFDSVAGRSGHVRHLPKSIFSEEAAWASRPEVRRWRQHRATAPLWGGYFPVPRSTHFNDIRAAMS